MWPILELENMNIYETTTGKKEMRLKKEKVKIRAITASQMEPLKIPLV